MTHFTHTPEIGHLIATALRPRHDVIGNSRGLGTAAPADRITQDHPRSDCLPLLTGIIYPRTRLWRQPASSFPDDLSMCFRCPRCHLVYSSPPTKRILSCVVLCRPVPSCLILCYLIQSSNIQSCSVASGLVLGSLIYESFLSCLVSSSPVVSNLVLSSPVVSCPVRLSPVMSGQVRSCLDSPATLQGLAVASHSWPPVSSSPCRS